MLDEPSVNPRYGGMTMREALKKGQKASARHVSPDSKTDKTGG